MDQRDQRIGIVTLVAYDHLRLQPCYKLMGLRNVGHLTTGQNPAQRIAQSIHHSMAFGAQSTPRATERLCTFFYWAPAACWWARTAVLSMNNTSKSASSLTASITRVHTPFLLQREKRVYVACQLPSPGSRSRQGEPVRAIHSTASTNSRLSLAVTPRSVALPGTMSLIRSYWSSRSNFLGIASGTRQKTRMYQPTSIVYRP
jgi:hypothetical protein